LYSSAAYEEALAALDSVDVAGDGERIESAEYRILCLLGMASANALRRRSKSSS
jgi:hypothetical protein